MNTIHTYERCIYPLLERFHVDAEDAHHHVIALLHLIEKNPQLLFVFEKLVQTDTFQYTNDRLKTTIGGVNFPNPLLLPAGYDKNGEAVNAFLSMGFGAVEVGTVPHHPQAGNPRPRVFRPKENAVLNRYGFNSDGAQVVAKNLQNYTDRKGVLGVSIGMNKGREPDQAPRAHRESLAQVLEHADFFTINVSSPNTEGLRALQTYDHMKAIVSECVREMLERQNVKPIFIKLAPDLSIHAVDDMSRLVQDYSLAGLMLTNTTNNTEIKASLGQKWKDQAGGVSGEPLRALSTSMIAHVHKTSPHIPIIGMGGIRDLDTALDKFEAGASAIGFLTSLVFSGPSLPSVLLHQLDTWLDMNGVKNIQEIVGVNL